MKQHEHVYEALLEPLTAVYGVPNKPEFLEAFYREHARLLHKYSRAILEGAKDRLYRSHPPSRGQRWPSIPEIIQACDDEQIGRAQLAKLGSEKLVSERERQRREMEAACSPEAFIIANELVKSAMGRLAVEQGWILGLHDFCRRHRRLPDAVTESKAIVEMKANAKYFDQSFDACSAVLQSTARIMRAKRKKLRDLVLREDASC